MLVLWRDDGRCGFARLWFLGMLCEGEEFCCDSKLGRGLEGNGAASSPPHRVQIAVVVATVFVAVALIVVLWSGFVWALVRVCSGLRIDV